ncbi:MAG: catalase, partial [Sphingomonas sp.]
MSEALKPPVAFTPNVETTTEDESETSQGLNKALHDILETTSENYGHAVRSVHAKSHGLLEGTLTINDNLPAELAQGVFAKPGEHPVVMRFSTNPGDILDDSISVPRGLAFKLLDVAGDRLPGSESETTQDFIMINGPAFATPNAKPFLANLKLLAKTTDKAEGAK